MTEVPGTQSHEQFQNNRVKNNYANKMSSDSAQHETENETVSPISNSH